MLTVYALIVIMSALIAANLPFIQRRFLGIWQPQKWIHQGIFVKPFWLRLIEMLIYGLICAAIAVMLERHINLQNYPQRWEFFAVVIVVYLVMATPGFIYCYLWRARKPQQENVRYLI